MASLSVRITSNVDGAGIGDRVDIFVMPLVVVMVRHDENDGGTKFEGSSAVDGIDGAR